MKIDPLPLLIAGAGGWLGLCGVVVVVIGWIVVERMRTNKDVRIETIKALNARSIRDGQASPPPRR